MKRILALLFLLVLLCGCTAGEEADRDLPSDQVTLRYYTIGRADQDLKLVNEELNRLLSERYGFQVDYRKLDFNAYEGVVNEVINTNQEFDVLFTWDSHYSHHASQGAFLNLTDYLQGEGRELYDTVDPRFWQGARVGGQIYAVPTNKELAPVVQFLFSRDLVDKYQVRPASFRTMHSLEPLLAMIHREEPDVIPLMLTSERLDITGLLGYQYVAGGNLPFVVKQGDPACQVVNLYETEEMTTLMTLMRRYYEKGYINPDAALRTSISRFPEEKVFCRIGVGGPDSQQSFSVDYGYPIETIAVSKPLVTNTSARGGMMAINADSPHKKEALAFLAAVNLDPDVRNLLNFGVEGIHYSLTDQDQVHVLSDGYRGVPYTQGNWFLLKTMEGEPLDKWKQYEVYNAQARSSRLLGFEPDLSQLHQELNQVTQVYLRYDTALLTGSVDPDLYMEKILRQMDLAGARKIERVLQSQVDAWLQSQRDANRNED